MGKKKEETKRRKGKKRKGEGNGTAERERGGRKKGRGLDTKRQARTGRLRQKQTKKEHTYIHTSINTSPLLLAVACGQPPARGWGVVGRKEGKEGTGTTTSGPAALRHWRGRDAWTLLSAALDHIYSLCVYVVGRWRRG